MEEGLISRAGRNLRLPLCRTVESGVFVHEWLARGRGLPDILEHLPPKTRVCLQCRRPGFDPWGGKILWRRKWQPTPVFFPRKSHGWMPFPPPGDLPDPGIEPESSALTGGFFTTDPVTSGVSFNSCSPLWLWVPEASWLLPGRDSGALGSRETASQRAGPRGDGGPRGTLSSTPRPPVTGLPVPWGRARDPADAGGAREAGGAASQCWPVLRG